MCDRRRHIGRTRQISEASDIARWRDLPNRGHTHLKVAFKVTLACA